MAEANQRARLQEAAQLLQKALVILDELENHVAAAQLDHLIHGLHSMPGNDVEA